MWKLKENIEFKELEKFGFKEDNGIYIKMTEDGSGRDSGTREYLIVNYEDNDRTIYHREEALFAKADNYEIQDLIQANLVEKINN